MANDDLDIRLVRLERQITLITRLVISIISIAVAALVQMPVARITGSELLGIGAMAASEHRQI